MNLDCRSVKILFVIFVYRARSEISGSYGNPIFYYFL